MHKRMVITYKHNADGYTTIEIVEQTVGAGDFPISGDLGDGCMDYYQDIGDVTVQLSSCDRPEIRKEYSAERQMTMLYFFMRGMDESRFNSRLNIETELFNKYIAPAVLGFNQLHSKNKLELGDVVIPEGEYNG